jgi:hypothetical protein
MIKVVYMTANQDILAGRRPADTCIDVLMYCICEIGITVTLTIQPQRPFLGYEEEQIKSFKLC